MTTATHRVVVPFPQAFASRKRSPFPCAPRYGTNGVTREDHQSLDGYSAPFGMIRLSLLFVLWVIRSCFYLSERFSLEPTNMIRLSKYLYKCTIETYQCQVSGLGKPVFRLSAAGFQARRSKAMLLYFH